MRQKRIIVATIIMIVIMLAASIYLSGFKAVTKQAGSAASFNVYFGNSDFDPGSTDCSQVFQVRRSLVNSAYGVERDAVESLLQGPSSNEKAKGYFSPIESGASLRHFEIRDGVAYVELDLAYISSGKNPCVTDIASAEISSTLKQFRTVKNVAVRVESATSTSSVP